MIAFLWGTGLSLLAFVLHVLLWKIRVPRRQRKTLVVIFAVTILAGLAVMTSGGALSGRSLVQAPAGFFGILYAVLLSGSLAMAYIALHIALEGDSPSLSIVRKIGNAGPSGLEEKELSSFMAGDRFVRSRMRMMVVDGMAREKDGKFYLAPKGERLLSFYNAYRTLARMPKQSL